MPRKEIDYSNTHFYKIVCKDLNIKDCYVGHTANFKNRKSAHKTSHYNSFGKSYNNHVNNKYLYKFIKENGGWDNWDMTLIETLNCENEMMAKKKEREYIEKLNATLNTARPTRTEDEAKEYKKLWTERNKEHVKETKHEWYERIKDKFNQERREKYKANKERKQLMTEQKEN